MSFYPEEIITRWAELKFGGEPESYDTKGTAASFECGSFVRFYLSIDTETLVINDIRYRSNGCGYAITAAEGLAVRCRGKALSELGGLGPLLEELRCDKAVTGFPPERIQCLAICENALRVALANFRKSRVAEFTGEKALICSCFGVDEETIERAVETTTYPSVDTIAAITNAGTGCGSCRMLIQEIIDDRTY